MGGHAAWRKRVAAGDLAKGMGGAIMRHRPRWGRKKEELILNRKGHIAGGNPKKKKKRKSHDTKDQAPNSEEKVFDRLLHPHCNARVWLKLWIWIIASVFMALIVSRFLQGRNV